MTTPVPGADVSQESIGPRENTRRWYALRYLRTCSYPATIAEVSEYVGPRVGLAPRDVESALRSQDVPALAACGAIEFDPESGLVCLDDRESFADRVRRAITADVLSNLKPPRLKRNRQGVFY
ncbi:MAG: hypothetical protein M8354_12380 [Halalkalicoccus sp.]|nr:hypothetical protein [Halalkalicoccus sp.]